MSWTNIDDRIMSHPKMKRATKLRGDAAWCMWSRGLVYTNAYDLDGRVPRDVIDELTTDRKPFDVAQTLVDVGLWESRDDGDYQVHDFADYNDSRLDRDARRRASKDRLKKHRDRKAGVQNETPNSPDLQRDGNANETRFTHVADADLKRVTKSVIPSQATPSQATPSRSSDATPAATAPLQSDDPDTQAILDKLASEPSLASVATMATAYKLVAHVHSGAKKLDWVLQAIGEYAEDATIAGPQPNDTRFASGLRKYVEAARAPAQVASGGGSSYPGKGRPPEAPSLASQMPFVRAPRVAS